MKLLLEFSRKLWTDLWVGVRLRKPAVERHSLAGTVMSRIPIYLAMKPLALTNLNILKPCRPPRPSRR
jgi:hypothetical protein